MLAAEEAKKHQESDSEVDEEQLRTKIWNLILAVRINKASPNLN